MSYQTQDTAAKDSGFRIQVRQAVIIAATQIQAEPTNTTNHPARSTLATSILGFFGAERSDTWTQAAATDGVTLPGASDAQVLARVQSLWNAFAGGM